MLWSGDHLFPGIPDTIAMLRKKGMLLERAIQEILMREERNSKVDRVHCVQASSSSS